MNWYIAVLVISAVNRGENDVPLIDLQFRLIRAPNPEVAYKSALELGTKQNHVYKAEEDQEVEWRFQGLNDLRRLEGNKIVSGMEVYSRIIEGDPAELIVPREELSVFLEERGKNKMAAELLEEK